MNTNNEIGNRIKTLRETMGYTQRELAIKLGLKGETAIANYEAGYSIPKDPIKLELCHIFSCSLDYLMCKSNIRDAEKQLKQEFENKYYKEMEGLTAEEILKALKFYKKIKK